MANKLTRLLDRIETRLEELKARGVIRSLGRELLQPESLTVWPALAIVPGEFRRLPDRTYACDIVLQLVCKSDAKIEATTIDTCAEIDEAIDQLAAESGIGGTIEQPHWQIWAQASNKGLFVKVGAWGGLTVRVDAPLKL